MVYFSNSVMSVAILSAISVANIQSMLFAVLSMVKF
jgi:hypothetical protein